MWLVPNICHCLFNGGTAGLLSLCSVKLRSEHQEFVGPSALVQTHYLVTDQEYVENGSNKHAGWIRSTSFHSTREDTYT